MKPIDEGGFFLGSPPPADVAKWCLAASVGRGAEGEGTARVERFTPRLLV